MEVNDNNRNEINQENSGCSGSCSNTAEINDSGDDTVGSDEE